MSLTMEDLEKEWETAEKALRCNVRDVLIMKDDEDNYVIRRMDCESKLDPQRERILTRRIPEPWEAIADLMDDVGVYDDDGYENSDKLAQLLYERGVRVKGEDIPETKTVRRSVLSDEAVERAARMLFDRNESIEFPDTKMSWESVTDDMKKHWVDDARAAITAALGEDEDDE